MTSEKPRCSTVYDRKPPETEEQISDEHLIAGLRHDNDQLRQAVADLAVLYGAALDRIRELEEGRS